MESSRAPGGTPAGMKTGRRGASCLECGTGPQSAGRTPSGAYPGEVAEATALVSSARDASVPRRLPCRWAFSGKCLRYGVRQTCCRFAFGHFGGRLLRCYSVTWQSQSTLPRSLPSAMDTVRPKTATKSGGDKAAAPADWGCPSGAWGLPQRTGGCPSGLGAACRTPMGGAPLYLLSFPGSLTATRLRPIIYPIGYLKPRKSRMAIRVVAQRCPQNHRCPSARVCPVGALCGRGTRRPRWMTRNASTGRCVRACPTGALRT